MTEGESAAVIGPTRLHFSGGITYWMQPLRTGKPCGTKHATIFIPFHSRF
jgi:hypothetical protein